MSKVFLRSIVPKTIFPIALQANWRGVDRRTDELHHEVYVRPARSKFEKIINLDEARALAPHFWTKNAPTNCEQNQ